MSNESISPQRIIWMDQLRGLAAFFVIAHHFYFADLDFVINQYFNLGILGVTVFFCISGYVIPLSIKQSHLAGVKQFLLSRFLRLYPAYWFSILLGVLLFGASLKQIFFNITMFQELFKVKSILGVYWTLTVELCYYLIIAILVWVDKLKNRILLINLSLFFAFLSLVFALIRYFLNLKTPLALPLGLSTMFFLTFYCITIKIYKEEFKIDIKTFVVGLFLVLSYFYGYSKDWGFNENPYRFILMNGLGLTLFFLFQNLNLKSNLILFLGKVSYSSYLLHIPISKLIDNVFPVLIQDGDFYLKLLLKFIFVYFVAWLSYRYIESPFIEISKKLRKV